MCEYFVSVVRESTNFKEVYQKGDNYVLRVCHLATRGSGLVGMDRTDTSSPCFVPVNSKIAK